MTDWRFGEGHPRSQEDAQREHHHHDSEHAELELLREQVRLAKQELEQLRIIAGELAPRKLSSIKIAFTKGESPMPVGPLTIAAGKKFTATVVGFDQNGAAYTGPIPAGSFTVDNSAVATVDATGAGTAVSSGVANVTAIVTSAEGLALSDTETVTVTAVVPVLSSIKVSLDAV